MLAVGAVLVASGALDDAVLAPLVALGIVGVAGVSIVTERMTSSLDLTVRLAYFSS